MHDTGDSFDLVGVFHNAKNLSFYLCAFRSSRLIWMSARIALSSRSQLVNLFESSNLH